MSRILLIGHNPPPLQAGSKVAAIHYRTWQFLEPLLNNDHAVCLCAGRSDRRPIRTDLPKNLSWHSVPFDKLGWMRHLQELHEAFQPDCILAIDFYPSLYATRLHTSRPVWMDLYGDPMTITQVARYRAGTDQGIGTNIALTRQLLQRGDVFSVCGVPQQHALVGELAMCGRLNSRTFGYDFVRVVYPGAPVTGPWADRSAREETRRKHNIDPDAFVVLWCGGFNTWTDVSTLFRALEGAMAEDARIHFVSLGASTYQAPETAYDRFVGLVDRSQHRRRFHLLGWRPWEEIPSLYRASDLGISIDALHYETIYGTRTRLVEMLAHGLPVITTGGCELSYIVQEEACGLIFAPGDWAGMTDGILQLARDPAKAESMRRAARDLVSRKLAFENTVRSLLAWVDEPQPAPDNVHQPPSVRMRAAKYRMRTMMRLLLWQLGLSGRRM